MDKLGIEPRASRMQSEHATTASLAHNRGNAIIHIVYKSLAQSSSPSLIDFVNFTDSSMASFDSELDTLFRTSVCLLPLRVV